MAVSSTSIIHYTKELTFLEGIISSSGFRLKYCLESVLLNNTQDGNPVKIDAAFPMVSFCDLPLTHAKEQIDNYGSYGIGLSKEWAKRNKINPVLYLENGSPVSQYILSELYKINKLRNTDGFDGERDRITQLIGFCKNHEGELIRRNKPPIPNYTFYNEREWRFIPSKELLGSIPLSIGSLAYLSDKQKYNGTVGHLYLRFGYNDIKYIMVESENDINSIVTCLRTKYEKEGIPVITLNGLYTKIFTSQQLSNDF